MLADLKWAWPKISELPFPSAAEWMEAVNAGFESNGATCSPDTIYGVEITNVQLYQDGGVVYPPLPADLQDLRFFFGGSEEEYHLSNDELLNYARWYVKRNLTGWKYPLRPLAWIRCRAYWLGVETPIGYSMWCQDNS